MRNQKQNRKKMLVNLRDSRLFRYVMTVLFCTLTSLNVFAQKKAVTGQVFDSNNEPLIGVNVVVKGTTNATMTDVNGNFNISVTNTDVLVFSFLGTVQQEITVGTSTVLKVVLKDDVRVLDEVVAIGYGTARKGDLTTAITSISTKDLDQRPIVSADQALQGKAAGVSVVKPNGQPGQSMVIRVRGTTSMNSSNDPLYVVDGVQMDNISFLSANDIESMDVLKDASSAAIYGSRAANGVILITTKTGKVGATKVSLSSYGGVTSLTKRIESLNVNQYRELLEDMGSSTAIPDDATDVTDWYDEAYQNAFTQNHQVSVSSGNDKLKYYISGGYTKEDGILKVAFYERYNFRSNVENQIKPWLKVGANLSYSDYSSNGIISGQGANRAGVVLSVINTPTYATVWDPNHPGQYNSDFSGVNITSPSENMARSEDNKSTNNRLLATGNAEIKFSPNLKYKSSVTLDRYYYNYTSFLDPIKTSYGRSQNGEASDNRSLSTVMIYDNILTFDKKMGLHSLDLMGGTSATTSDYSQSYQTVSNFIDGTVKTLNGGNKVSQGNGTNASQWAIMSYIGRAAYNYDRRYLFTANMRVDGSSKLHPNHRWGYFPSASAAWRISSEEFMKDFTWMDDFKFRAGWGQTGNQAGLGDYDYLAGSSISRQNWWETGKSNATPIITQSTLQNSELTWETTTQSNIGFDLATLNNRLNFTLDFYYKLTTNMLMNVSLPSGSAIASSITRNEGEMTNKGMELAINSKIMEGPFKWGSDFNISFNRNELTKLELSKIYYTARASDVMTEYIVRNEPGRSLGGFYGYIADGVDTETGEMIFRDLNGNGQITSSDRTYIGDPNPDFTYGFTNNFSFQNLNLSVLLQGSYGNDVFNASRIETEGMYDGKNQSTRVLDRWRRPGMDSSIPKAGYDMKISSYFVEDGSFLRVKDVTLSYNLTTGLMKKWGVTRFQPYVTATNLLTLTKYLGFDPEVNQWGSSGTVQGIDWGTYPQTRSFIVGINIEF